MTEEKLEQSRANPYNANKSWHEGVEDGAGVTADTLFFEEEEKKPNQATQSKTPDKKRGRSESSTNYKKRYDDLKRHYDDKVAEFRQREQELNALAKVNEPQYTPPKTPEELEAFKSKYPELFETVETVAHMRSQEQMNAVQSKLSAIEEREARLARHDAEQKLRERHPDFEKIRTDNTFHEWAKEQPEEIQGWIYRNPDNVGLASRAIDIFKLEKGIKIHTPNSSKSVNKSNNAADFVSTRTTGVDAKEPKIWTQKEIASLSIDEFEKYEQDIDQAIMEGRVRN